MLLSGRFVTKSMRESRIAGILLFTLLAFVAATSSAAAEERRVYPGYIVTTKQSQNFAVAADASPSLSAKGLHVQRELGRKQVLVMPGSAQFAVSADEAPQQVVPYNPATDLCPSLLSSGAVESCSPNYEVRASAIPNDTNFGGLWGMSESMGIDAPGAWEVSTGSNDVVVAIIDTGIDYTHPDLAANIWTNTLETPGNGIDDDHNGIVDDVHGANFSHENNPANNLGKGDPRDNNMHGTHVAGTIGGIGNNARGVAGVNWNVKMMALKFLNSSGSGSLADAVSAINYMIAMKNRGVNIRVANNSWGGGGYSAALFNAISAARDAGILFVAAAGNEANDNDAEASYPASYEVSNVVSVAAIDSDQNLASFSNYGRTKVDIAAPGVGIFSTVPGGNYASLSGTSMATPHVAGALALLLSHEPSLSNDQALSRMYDSGVPLSALQDVVRTARKLNVKRMLLNETAPVVEPAPELPCHYSIEEIAFNPDQSVANQPIVLQADELSFYTLDMPFAFPFYRSQVTSLKVSPNGVVYKKAPTSFDYANLSRAPLNSIAPLQTDLSATPGSSDGVHVLKESDRVVVYWDAKTYDSPTGANVKVWLHLYANGVIEQYVSFGSASVLKAVRKQATVGMSGPTRETADTYAYNSKQITNGLSLRYTPQCSGEDAGDTAEVKRIKVTSNGSNVLLPGNKVGIRLSGRGYGSVPVRAAFNGQLCQNEASGTMVDGRLNMQGRFPKASFERFSVMSNGVQARMRVANSGRRSASSKRLSSRSLQSLCGKFFKTLH